MLYTVLYNKIGEYANLLNLNNFLEYNELLIYLCDSCNCKFYQVRPKNIMMYELESFDNNALGHRIKKYEMNIIDYVTLSAINLKKCRYKRINKVLCGLCSYCENKHASSLNYCDYGIANYISKNHYNFIKFNKCFYTNDHITETHVYIKRYNYYFRNNEEQLNIRSIFLNNQQNIIRELVKNPSFLDIKNLIEHMFRLNFSYLNKFLKIKHN